MADGRGRGGGPGGLGGLGGLGGSGGLGGPGGGEGGSGGGSTTPACTVAVWKFCFLVLVVNWCLALGVLLVVIAENVGQIMEVEVGVSYLALDSGVDERD